MTSILKVDSIQNAAGSVSIPVMAGAIIQTQVHQEDGLTYFAHPSNVGDDQLLLAGNANDNVSHLSVTITPTSATSKILLTTSVFFEGSNIAMHEYLWCLYRDTTKLGQPRVGSRRGGIASTGINYPLAQDATSTPDITGFSFLDNPNTTSQITYAVAFNHSGNSGNLFLNRTVSDTDSIAYERGVSIIIAQEIAQ